MSDVTCRFMCVVIFVPCLQPAQLETIGEVVYSYQYKYISIYIYLSVCVFCVRVLTCICMFLCACAYPCVCVCACVCACVCVCPSVWCVCACVCCKILAARITFHVCVSTLNPVASRVLQDAKERELPLEDTEDWPHRRRAPCLGYWAPYEIRISIQWIRSKKSLHLWRGGLVIKQQLELF